MQTRANFLMPQFYVSSVVSLLPVLMYQGIYDFGHICLVHKITTDYSILFLLQNAFFVFLPQIDTKAI